ncbi:MAG: nuclear transport factor 2 family protein [Calditrichaceae bacterium]|nr:nuclear transport factor 2 family protein [Calditrichia bacterium]NUQ40697.1 nuclear transport factor 2 family protein [Calditrichaceae bacterium]
MNNHLKTVSAIYDAFGRGNIPGILEHLSADVRWEEWADNTAQKAGVPWLQPRNGKMEVPEFFKIIGSLRFIDFRVLSLMAGGNQVAAEIMLEVEIPETGRHFRDEEMHLWTFDEYGKVIRLRHYTDTAKHMAAAGKV